MNSYDELPYESVPIVGTCPPPLALASFLHGGPRPPVVGFRALELGCGNGTNLLPLAFYHPDSEFLGVDSSAGAIGDARAGAEEIGLRNVRFEVVDLSEPGELLAERFHYVIAHGIFSWVAEEVREGILDVCETSPTPDGLVYLSHNVRAGWRVRSLVREMLVDAVGGARPLAEQVRRAKELAARLRKVLEGSDHAQQVQLAWELDRVVRAKDSYLYHEYLLPENRPFRHGEVAGRLAERGYGWLCDALYADATGRVPEGLRSALDDLGYEGEPREEMADFLGCRTFRSSVFARSDAISSAGEPPSLRPLDDMYTATDLRARSGAEFADASGRTVTATGPLARAALDRLAEASPRFLRIRDVLRGATRRAGRPAAANELEELRRDLVTLHVQELVTIRPDNPRGIGAGPGRGRLHALARYESRRGEYLTTPLHTRVPLHDEDGEPLGPARLARWGLIEPA